MKPNLIQALRYTIFPLIASCIFLLHHSSLQAATQLSTQVSSQMSTVAPMPVNALVELDVATIAEMAETITFIESQGGKVPLSFAPQALFAYIPPEIQPDSWATRTDILAIHQGVARLTTDDPQALLAKTVWNQWQQEPPFALSQAAAIQASQNRAQHDHAQHDHAGHDHSSPHEAIRAMNAQAIRSANVQATDLTDCSNLAANRFPNPNCFQTSEFFIGGYQVDLFLPESTINSSNTENWSKTRRNEVVNGIASSLLWWFAASQQVDPAPDFSYNLTVHDPFVTPADVATEHEPILTNAQINFNSSEDRLWIGEIMENVGYPGSTQYDPVPSHMVAMWQYVDARRQEMMQDWGFVIFVADSQNNEDGFFADGRSFAYAGRPGPHVVLTYDNGPNSEQIGAVNGIKINMAHEMGHIIDSPEEYRDHCDPNNPSGYLHVLNSNCESGGDLPLEDSVMRSPLNQRIAFTNLSLPMSIRRMAGWQDSDGDGILDPVDTTPMIAVHGPTQLSDGRYRYSGRVTDIAFSVSSVRETRTSRTPSTINTIVAAEYRLDNSPWQPCLFNGNELTLNGSSGDFQCDFASPPVGQHTLAFRARNSVGNYSDILVQTLDIAPPSVSDVPDIAPQGTLSLSGGDGNVLGSPTAHLVLSASDDQNLFSGGMYRLHYGGQWQDWKDYEGYTYLELDSQQVDHDLSVQYRDSSGNTSQEYATMVKLDMKPPTCVISDIRVDPDSTDVVLTFDNSDQESAVSGTNLYYYDDDAEQYQWQGWTQEMTKTTVAIAENGIYNFTLRCRDQAYNQGQTSQQLTVDRTGPAGTIQEVETVWNDGQIHATLHFAASDNLPGITSYRLYYGGEWHDWTTVDVAFTFADTALVMLDPGQGTDYTFQIQFRDGSGNVSDIHSKDVEILNNAPVGSIQDIEKSWRGDELDATLHFTAKSIVGGINGYRLYYSSEWHAWEDVDLALALAGSATATFRPTNDTHQVQIQFRDAAGNMSKINSYDIQVSSTDRRGPTGSLVIGTIEPLAVQGFNETSGGAEVTLRISAQDRESEATRMNLFDGTQWLGWEPIQATKRIEVRDGIYNFQIQFRDSVNNVSDIISQNGVIIDTISPTGSIEVTTKAVAEGVAQATIKLRILNTESLDTVQMRLFYNDQWHSWEEYANIKTVILERQGLQDFQAQFRDSSQNTSTIYTIPDQPVDTIPPVAWTNLLDNFVSTKISTFLIEWMGDDKAGGVGSGIQCYDVRYSTDEGATWTLWQDCVTETSAELEGEVGQTYYIQVRAIDNAGNIGEYPDISASTKVLFIGEDGEPPTSDTILYLPVVYWTARGM